jgi:cyanate permease
MSFQMLDLPIEREYSPVSVTICPSQETTWKIELNQNHLWLWASMFWLNRIVQECGFSDSKETYQMQLTDPAILHLAYLLMQQIVEERSQNECYVAALAEVLCIYVLRSCPGEVLHLGRTFGGYSDLKSFVRKT